jgi:hypothetical protein
LGERQERLNHKQSLFDNPRPRRPNEALQNPPDGVMKIIPIAFTAQELSDFQSVLDLAASRLPRPWALGESSEPGDFHIISMDRPEEFSKHLRISPHLDSLRIIAYTPEDPAAEARWVLRKRPNSPPRMSELWNLLANIERYLLGLDTDAAEENRQTVADEPASRGDSFDGTLVPLPDRPVAPEDASLASPPMAEDAPEGREEHRQDVEDDLPPSWDGLSTIALMPSSSLAFETEDTPENTEDSRTVVDKAASRDESSTEIPVASADAPIAAEAEPPSPAPMAEEKNDSEDSDEHRRNVEDDLANWDGLFTIALMPSSSLAFEAEDAPPAQTTALNNDLRVITEDTPMHADSPSTQEIPLEAGVADGNGEAQTGEEKSGVLSSLRFSQVQQRDWLKTMVAPASLSAKESLPELLQQTLKDQTARLFFINGTHVIVASPREENCHFLADLESTLLLFRTYPGRVKTKALTLKQVQAYLQKYGAGSVSAPLSELSWLAAIIDSRAALLPDLSAETPVRLVSAATLVTLPYFEEFSSLTEVWLSDFLSLQQASEKAGEPMGKTVAFYNAGALLRLFEANPRTETGKIEPQDARPASGKTPSPTLLQRIGGVFKGKRPGGSG